MPSFEVAWNGEEGMVRTRVCGLAILFCILVVGQSIGAETKGRVLMIVRSGNQAAVDFMLAKEVGVMKSTLTEAGFTVVTTTATGEAIKGSTKSLVPDLKLSDAEITDYRGFILPCMAAGNMPVPEEAVAIVQKALALGKPIAAQNSAVQILSEAGALKGRHFAIEAALTSRVADGTCDGIGVVQDGNIVTSGTCPFVARVLRKPDGTVELTKKFIDLLVAPASSKPQENAQRLQAPIGSAGLIIEKLSLQNVFPILHTYYDSNPLGTLVIKNTEGGPVSEVEVSLFVRQFMDAPKTCASFGELRPGEQRSVSLFALFKNNVFEIKQATKVPAEITVSYKLDDKPQTLNRVETIRIYDRNAMSWDDTNKAAAFVMPKEPAVLMLSNQINSLIRPKMNRAIDHNLQSAIGLHEALRLVGIAYVSSPLTSYAVISQDKTAIDSVKFPLETIEYRSGDCSDLSILYSSLLESVQVETAFITIPGHIFIAFALGYGEEEVRKAFSHTDEFIFRDGTVWVPLEVTLRDRSFLDAWQMGAREWRENLAKRQVNFYSVRSAWNTYEPVNYPGIGGQPPLPDKIQLVKSFQEEVSRLVAREIHDREADLLAAIGKSTNSPKLLNSLGVLYAKYDLESKAEAEFQAAVKKQEYLYALLNLGNLRLQDKRDAEALEFFQRAAKVAPHDPLVLLGLARANHEMQNYGLAISEYEELRTRDPELAARFGYLRLQEEEATRAAEGNPVGDILIWGEED